MRTILFVFTLLSSCLLSAQISLPTPRNIAVTYEKGTRSVTGAPGKNYWQNRADYKLDIEFSPSTRFISGIASITYTNQSPDTLQQVWFKLNTNYYKQGAPRSSPISPEDEKEGLVIDQFLINGKIAENSIVMTNYTNMKVEVPVVERGGQIHFLFRFHYTLNKGSHMRTGEIEPGAAFIAYFFPRIAVYDDIDGWNKFPYNGSLEFYNDFCHFDARIRVPENFVVWATGELKNAGEVLAPTYLERLKQAEQNDGITTIIDSTDLKSGNITASGTEHTWHFEANNVTDFVFATSDHYLWKSSSLVVDPMTKRRTRVDAVFNPQHKDYFKVVEDVRKTVEVMSYTFPAWPFPYSHETIFDGLDQMEYPMMANDNPLGDRAESIELTVHEVFHTMFPFYLGINETKYAWMEEGWATIAEWLISPMIESAVVDEYGVERYSLQSGTEADLPVMTLSTELNKGYFINSYPKPGMGFLYIKDMLGDALFTKALHHFIEQWQGKHPMPNDFFYCMNEGSGRNLNWFWKNWFFDPGFPDLAIGSVIKKGKGYTITIANKGSKWVPIDLLLEYADGTTEKLHRSIAVWEKAPASVLLNHTTSKQIKKITLIEPHVPDANRDDNEYIAR